MNRSKSKTLCNFTLFSLAVIVFFMQGCATTKPTPVDPLAYKDRTKSSFNEGVTVTVAVPTIAEARAIYGVDLAAKYIQPVWLEIENSNMDKILLEKAPEIAVYSPPGYQPWDDAVTLTLTYAEIPYDIVYDTKVLSGILSKYDWLHLHHEDFTGQYGKFWAAFRNQPWYIKQKLNSEKLNLTSAH